MQQVYILQVDLEALHALIDDFGRGADDQTALDVAIQKHTHYYMNDIAVSEKELQCMFGVEENLTPFRITEANIRQIILNLSASPDIVMTRTVI